MQRHENRTVEVELVEDDVLDPVGAPGGAGHAPEREPLARVLRRVPREVVLTLVAALALGGAGVAVARVGTERALDARLAAVPGLTRSLAAQWHEVWTAGGGGLVATAEDVVVHWSDNGVGVVGTDLRDGTTRYEVPGPCQLVPTEGGFADRFLAVGPAAEVQPGDVLLCIENGANSSVLLGVRETTARVVDVDSGRTLRSIAMLASDNWTVVDGDVVSIGLDAERRVQAGRWSLTTGEQRWAHHGSEPAPDVVADGLGMSLSDRTIGLMIGEWTVDLDVETGAEAEPPAPGDLGLPPETAVDLADGRQLVYRWERSGDVRTTVHPPDGGEPVTVDGLVVVPGVDDGSVPDAVPVIHPDSLAEGQRLALVDLPGGETRWTSEAQGGAVGLLGGVVVVTDHVGTSALDARTGELRWESESEPTSSFGWQVVSDGRRVLVLEGEGEERQVVARDVRTGARVWSVEQPIAGAALLPLADGSVLAVGSYEMALLRP